MKKWTKLEIEALVLNYEGVSARDLSIETGRSIRAIIQKAKKLRLKSKLRDKGNNRNNTGPNNPNWKGIKKKNNLSKNPNAIHQYLKRKYKRPEKCFHCKKKKYVVLANIKNHNYTRNIKDYRWLCRDCHKKFDSGLIKLKED